MGAIYLFSNALRTLLYQVLVELFHPRNVVATVPQALAL